MEQIQDSYHSENKAILEEPFEITLGQGNEVLEREGIKNAMEDNIEFQKSSSRKDQKIKRMRGIRKNRETN